MSNRETRRIFEKVTRERSHPDSAPLRSSRKCIRNCGRYAMAGFQTCEECHKHPYKTKRCPDCGGPMGRNSTRCQKCHGRHMHEEAVRPKWYTGYCAKCGKEVALRNATGVNGHCFCWGCA